MILLFAGLILRYWQLQVVRSTVYGELARANHVRPVSEAAPRGLILDRAGRILAENRPSFSLTLEGEHLGTLFSIGELADLSKEKVDADDYREQEKLGPVLIKEELFLEEVARIESRQLELPGAHIQFVPRRFYPNGASVSHVVGHVGRITEKQLDEQVFASVERNDYVGQAGIEQAYNQFIMGQNGVQRFVVNSHGRRERILEQVPPIWGESLQISIDMNLQHVAGEAFGDDAGAVVALDPRNGQVLVLGSFPAYDPNSFSGRFDRKQWQLLVNDDKHPLSNRAIQGRYAPGSTFKVVVAAAALEQDLVTPETEMHCSGAVRLYGNVFKCHRASGHGSVNLIQALAQSCNSYFFQLGVKLRIELLARYGKMFGLGALTGIDLPHEVSGLVPDPAWKKRARNEPWYPGETVSVAVGQGSVLVTALQMAQVAATVGSSGDIHSPKIFLRRLPSGGEPESFPVGALEPPKRKVGLRAETWRALQEGMFQAVNGEGTAGRARVKGFVISGKTGTAQVASRSRIAETNDDERPEHLRNHAWFIGYGPRVNPEIAIAVLVEHGGPGGVAAAPIARKILHAYFDGRQEKKEDHGRKTTMAFP